MADTNHPVVHDDDFPMRNNSLITPTDTGIEVGDSDLKLFQLVLDKIEDKILKTPVAKLGFDDLQRAASAVQTMTVRKRIHLLGSDQVHKSETSVDENTTIALLSVNNADYLHAVLGQDADGNPIDFSQQNEIAEAGGVSDVEENSLEE